MSLSPAAPAAARKGTVVEALDPRVRLVAAFGIVVVVVVLQSLPAKACALALATLAMLATSPDLRLVVRRLAHVEGFMIVLFALLPFTVPGETLFTVGPLTASDQGFLRALSIALTMNAAVLIMLVLLATLEPVRLARALAGIGAPERLVQLLFFMVRYLGLLREELTRAREAMRVRGFSSGIGRHTLRSYGNLAGMLLVRSVERAERVDEAMRCRGFAGRFPLRTSKSLEAADFRFMLIAGIIAIGLVVWDRLA